MSKLSLSLIAVVAGLALLFGGIALGNTMRDDDTSDDPAGSSDTVAIAAATPALPDSSPDGPDEPFWPQPAAHQVPIDTVQISNSDPSGGDRDEPADAPTAGSSAAEPGSVSIDVPPTSEALESILEADAAATDPDPDSEPIGEPYRPPTTPGGLDDEGVGEPDPDADPVVADGVVEIDLDELLDELVAEGPAAVDDLTLPDPLPFRDPCADLGEDVDEDEAADRCPGGVGGTIVALGGGDDPPDPLVIMRQFYTSISVPLELRCPSLGLGDDGVYRPLFASNNPADFTIRYWPSSDPDAERTTTFRTSETEMDRWIERRIAGDAISANPHSGVHNCPEFEGLEPGQGVTFEVHGEDDFGTEATVRVFATVGRPASAPRGRPPVTFTGASLFGSASSGSGVLSIPYDSTREQVYMASLPRTGDRASETSCTEVEGDILVGRFYGDPSLQRTRVAPFVAAPGGPEFDPRFDSVALGSMYGEEGTTYELCVWVATPPLRSFDRPPVVLRESFVVRAPRALRVRVSVSGGHADQPLDADAVSVEATNWEFGAHSGSFPAEPVRATAFMLDGPVELFDSGPTRVPATSILQVTGPTGSTVLVEVPTRTRCNPFDLFFGCPTPGGRQYDVQIPGRIAGRGLCGSSFGDCDPPREQTYVGNLRLYVERFAGPGGAPTGGPDDGWQITPSGAFAPADPAELPATPQINSNNSTLVAVPNASGRPGMRMQLHFDRPVRVEAYPVQIDSAPCSEFETFTNDGFTSSVTFTWSQLCWRGAYSVGLLAVDEEGNELSLRPVVDGERTGRPGWGYVVLPGFPIEEFTVDVEIRRLGDGIRPQSLDMGVGGVWVGPLIAPGHDPRCRTDAVPHSTYTQTVRNSGGYPMVWADSVWVSLRVSGRGDGRGCGLDEEFVRVNLENQLWLDDLLASGSTALTYNEDDAEISIVIRDIVPG